MSRALYQGYSASFTMSAASTTLPAFVLANTDALHGLSLCKYRVAMGGTGGASVQVTIAQTVTGASAAGTNTGGTIVQANGRVMAGGGITICGTNYTAARTTETYAIIDEFYMPNNGTVIYDYPPGDEPDCVLGTATYGGGFAMFFAVGTPVASTVSMWVARN